MKKDTSSLIRLPKELKEKLKNEGFSVQSFFDKCLEKKFKVRLNGWIKKGGKNGSNGQTGSNRAN